MCRRWWAYGSDTWPWGIETTTRAATILGAELIEVQGSHHFGHVTHPAEFAAFARRAIELAPPALTGLTWREPGSRGVGTVRRSP